MTLWLTTPMRLWERMKAHFNLAFETEILPEEMKDLL